MYTIKRNGKKLLAGGVFKSYEKARQEARRMARKAFPPGARRGSVVAAKDIEWDSISRNPTSLVALGFTIHKVT